MWCTTARLGVGSVGADMDVTILLLGLAALQPVAEDEAPVVESPPEVPAVQTDPAPAAAPAEEAEFEETIEGNPDEPGPEPAPAEPEGQHPVESLPMPKPIDRGDEVEEFPTRSVPAPSWEEEGPEVVDGDPHQRKGGFASIGVGAGHCAAGCSEVPATFAGRFELGYRWGYVALGMSLMYGGGTYKTDESGDSDLYATFNADGSVRFLDVSPFVRLLFAPTGPFDPFVQLGFGLHRFADKSEIKVTDADLTLDYSLRSAGISLGAGVPIFVSRNVTIGPRFDKMIGFGGVECISIEGQPLEGRDRCEKRTEITQSYNNVDRRWLRLTRPRPWVVSVEARFTF